MINISIHSFIHPSIHPSIDSSIDCMDLLSMCVCVLHTLFFLAKKRTLQDVVPLVIYRCVPLLNFKLPPNPILRKHPVGSILSALCNNEIDVYYFFFFGLTIKGCDNANCNRFTFCSPKPGHMAS